MSKVLLAFQKRKEDIRRTVAKYRSNPADIDELTQETFLKGFAVELEQDIEQPEHLLLRIAKNLAINSAVRKVNMTTKSIESFGGMDVFADKAYVSQENVLDARQKLFVFSQALASLSSDNRRALVMRRIDGLKYKQIASRLNITVSAVEKRVSASMVDIMMYLRENGHDPRDFGANIRPKNKPSKLTSKNSPKFYRYDDEKAGKS